MEGGDGEIEGLWGNRVDWGPKAGWITWAWLGRFFISHRAGMVRREIFSKEMLIMAGFKFQFGQGNFSESGTFS